MTKLTQWLRLAQNICYRFPRWLLILSVSIAPAAAIWLIFTFVFHASLHNFVPNTLNDQVNNWRRVLTFSEVGFNGGYYGPHELTAPLSQFRFDVIGPTFPILYGTVAHFVGWYTFSSIFFNMIIIGLALIFFMRVARLDQVQIILTGLLALTYWSILIFMPTVMQESLNHAIAISLAGFFYILIDRQSASPRWVKCGAGGLLILASFLRASWGILLIPYFVLMLPGRFWVRLVIGSVASGLIVAVVILLLQYTSPPSNNTVLDALRSFSESFSSGVKNLSNAIQQNFLTLEATLRATRIFPLQLAQHLGIIALDLGIAALILLRKRNRPESSHVGDELRLRERVFQVYNLGMIILSGFALYLAAGFPRVFAAHLLVSLCIAIAFKRYTLILMVVVTNLLLAGGVGYDLAGYKNDNFKSDPEERAALQTQVNQYITYDPNANPWCNTMLIPVNYYDSRLTLFPAEIGISFFWNAAKLTFPLKSRYLLFDNASYQKFQDKLNVHLMEHLPIGDLYLNQDANCS